MSSPPMPTAPVSPPVAASIWDLANVSDFCSEAPSSSCEVEFSPVEEEGPPSINGSTSSPVPSRVLRNERLIREARMIGQSHRLWSENGVMYLMLPDTSMPVTRQGLLCKAFDEWRKICYCLAPLFADGNLSQSPERLRKVDALFLSARLYMCDVVPAYLSPPCGESMRRLRHSLAGLQRYSADALDMRHGNAEASPSPRTLEQQRAEVAIRTRLYSFGEMNSTSEVLRGLAELWQAHGASSSSVTVAVPWVQPDYL